VTRTSALPRAKLSTRTASPAKPTEAAAKAQQVPQPSWAPPNTVNTKYGLSARRKLPLRSSFVHQANQISKLFKTAHVFETGLGQMPQTRYFRVPPAWLKDVRSLQAAAAIVSERERAEVGVFKDKKGASWLTLGSANGIIPPDEVGTDSIFHVHPPGGEPLASEGDLQSYREVDDDRRANVVSASGFLSHYRGDQLESGPTPLWVPTGAPPDQIAEYVTNMFADARRQCDWLSARAGALLAKKVPTTGDRAALQQIDVDLQALERRLIGRPQPKHPSLPYNVAAAVKGLRAKIKGAAQ
jgi:hypothetical protein